MQVRRVLVALSACALMSLAPVATAQAKKPPGVAYVFLGTPTGGMPHEYELTVCKKTHTWGIAVGEETCSAGKYRTVKVKKEKKKYTYTHFELSGEPGTEYVALDSGRAYIDGLLYVEGELQEYSWEAHPKP